MDSLRALAVVVAVAAAAAFGSAGLLQHRATRKAPPRGPLRPGLLVDLVKVRAFRWGAFLGAVGFALQVVALSFGPLGLIQPILVTGVLFYLGIAALIMRQPPDGPLLGSAALTIVGLSGFLLLAEPGAGNADFSGDAVWPLSIALVVVVAVCLIVASRTTGVFRTLPLAIATAVFYGVTAGLVRSLTTTADLAILFGQWQLYAVIVLGPAGFLLNQNAYQAGRTGSLAIAVATVGDPVVALAVGAAWLGESLAGGPARIAGEVVSLLVMASGIVFLAGRAQWVSRHMSGVETDTPEVE